jgi:5'-nucleotidase
MTDLLLTNDDGYQSAGYITVLRELSKHFTVTAVAPDREKSWIGKAITTRKELPVTIVKKDQFEIFTIDATPADCVQIGIYGIMTRKPDVVVSGINLGENAGTARILSSGTIGATMEASFEGIKAIASSYSIPLLIKKSTNLYSPAGYPIFHHAAEITAALVNTLSTMPPIPGADVLSISIPYNATLDTPVTATHPFTGPYKQLFHTTHLGYLHSTPPLTFDDLEDGTDLKALYNNTISISPLNLTLTDPTAVNKTKDYLATHWPPTTTKP